MREDITIVRAADAALPAYRALLEQLDRLHLLRDSSFASPTWLHPCQAGDGSLRLLATRQGQAVGFLGGLPAIGHISIVGTVRPGSGTGSRLVWAFAEHARSAGASELTVSLDSEPSHRWVRRHFFESNGFTAQPGSALHFTRPLTDTPHAQRPMR
ncbi:GNAT family N-acetyltransferase [Nocardia suismassiliense]|uniref:GNAT family N-acetyltransferase n=1 Tax=Nocardia suismassiliense TaxID=2077092 RepID=UPI000D1F27D2|nr:GNAT family N-acetyltransferase [Nocardia suismassiliense]